MKKLLFRVNMVSGKNVIFVDSIDVQMPENYSQTVKFVSDLPALTH